MLSCCGCPAALSTSSESPFPYRDTLTGSLLRCTTSCDLSISSLRIKSCSACGRNLTCHSAKTTLSTVYTVHVRYNYITTKNCTRAFEYSRATVYSFASSCPVCWHNFITTVLPHTRNYHSTSNENASHTVPPCSTCLPYTTPAVCCSACSWRHLNAIKLLTASNEPVTLASTPAPALHAYPKNTLPAIEFQFHGNGGEAILTQLQTTHLSHLNNHSTCPTSPGSHNFLH